MIISTILGEKWVLKPKNCGLYLKFVADNVQNITDIKGSRVAGCQRGRVRKQKYYRRKVSPKKNQVKVKKTSFEPKCGGENSIKVAVHVSPTHSIPKIKERKKSSDGVIKDDYDDNTRLVTPSSSSIITPTSSSVVVSHDVARNRDLELRRRFFSDFDDSDDDSVIDDGLGASPTFPDFQKLIDNPPTEEEVESFDVQAAIRACKEKIFSESSNFNF